MTEAFIADPDYQNRATTAVMEGLLLGLMDPETRRVILRSGDIADVMLNMAAMVLAGSPVAESPTKLREYCTDFGKRLQRKVRVFEETYAKEGSPFERITIEGAPH